MANLRIILTFVASLCSFQIVDASSSATATVTWTIDPISILSISGNPAPYVVNAAIAGAHPTCAADHFTTYAVTTNSSDQKITALLDADLPDGISIGVFLQAPEGATTMGTVELSSAPQNLVTGISNVAQSDLAITYNMSVSALAAPASTASRTITYIIGP